MTLVTRDATSGKWLPASSAEFTSWLSGRGVAAPTVLYNMQDAAAPVVDGMGVQNLTNAVAPSSFQVTESGWSRKAITQNGAGGGSLNSTAGPFGDPYSASHLLFAIIQPNAGAATQDIMGFGGASAYRGLQITTAGNLAIIDLQTSTTTTGTASYGSTFHPAFLQYDRTNGLLRVVTDLETINAPYHASSTTNLLFTFGAAAVQSASFGVMWACGWRGSAAELSSSQIAAILDAYNNGPAVTGIAVSPAPFSITVGGTQQMDAIATRADGSTFDATSTATWSSSDTSVATVNSSGIVTAVSVGTSTITASFTSVGASTASGTAACTVGMFEVAQPIVGVDVPDLVAEALSRLLEQDKNKPNLAALLTAIVSPLQDVMNASWQLATQRTIYTAIGQQLDDIGALVGLARLGLSDDDYRVRLLVEIVVNRSRGRTEDLIQIASMTVDDSDATIVVTSTPAIPYGSGTLYLHPDGVVEVAVNGVALTEALGATLYSFLLRAVAGGVRLLLQWSDSPPSQTFRFDSGPGFNVGHLASALGG